MLGVAIPRLLSVVFRFAQPVLINVTIRYVTQPATQSEGTEDVTGTQIIFAAIIIYSGTIVSSAYSRLATFLQYSNTYSRSPTTFISKALAVSRSRPEVYWLD